MYKDTIHVDDYGSIKETLFKFPSLAKVTSSSNLFLIILSLERAKLISHLSLWR